MLCDTSIVRETAKDTVLIYNRRGVSTFSMVTVGNPYPWTIYIEPIYVNDFEVLGNMVYFCGYRIENEKKTAVLGFFRHTSFPYVDVYYYDLNRCTELRKLDVYQIAVDQFQKETHLVVTGTTGTRWDALVDFTVNNASLFNCCLYLSQDENESLDDVAVTKDYVVVSTRNTIAGNPVAKFWYYSRPLLTGQTIFLSIPDHLTVSSPMPKSPIILEHSKDNAFAAVYKEAGFSRMAMLTLEVPNNAYSIFEIVGDKAETVYPLDIKYNTRNSVYAILARYMGRDTALSPLMQIYHVTQGDLDGLTPYGQGTNYNEIYYHLWSLEPLRKTANRFVVSGGEGQLSRLFRFNHYQWAPCSNRFEYQYFIGRITGVRNPEEISIDIFNLSAQNQKPREIRPIDFPVRCGVE